MRYKVYLAIVTYDDYDEHEEMLFEVAANLRTAEYLIYDYVKDRWQSSGIQEKYGPIPEDKQEAFKIYFWLWSAENYEIREMTIKNI